MKIKNRDDLPKLLKQLKLNNEGVEIGVEKGIYSEIILMNSNLKLLYSIDSWKHFENNYIDIANVSQKKHNENKKETKQRLNKFNNRSKILQLTSKEASELFKDNSLDFTYIDANHSFEEINKDLKLWYPKVKIGGVFAGHDYIEDGKYSEGVFGVKSAVNNFIKKYNQKLFITQDNWASWYLIKNL